MTNHFLVKFRILKIHNVLDIKLIFLKLWIFTNFNTVFPDLVLVFDFEEFSEELLHGHLINYMCKKHNLLLSWLLSSVTEIIYAPHMNFEPT
jgi:hypothetical protein